MSVLGGALSACALRSRRMAMILRRTCGLTVGPKENVHVDTDYRLGVGLRGRWRVLRT